MRWHDIKICIALAASACSSQSDPTGSHIASDANDAFIIQIVSVLDGRVAGSLSILSVKPNGRIDAVRKPFSGTLEREAINTTIENGPGVSLITGRLAGRTMDLTFFAKPSRTRDRVDDRLVGQPQYTHVGRRRTGVPGQDARDRFGAPRRYTGAGTRARPR